jgi:hypothetical protein
MPCTTAIIGVVSRASHSIENPVLAPATEYVEMPEGSSSAAPVIKPGPRTEKNFRRGDIPFFEMFMAMWRFRKGFPDYGVGAGVLPPIVAKSGHADMVVIWSMR